VEWKSQRQTNVGVKTAQLRYLMGEIGISR